VEPGGLIVKLVPWLFRDDSCAFSTDRSCSFLPQASDSLVSLAGVSAADTSLAVNEPIISSVIHLVAIQWQWPRKRLLMQEKKERGMMNFNKRIRQMIQALVVVGVLSGCTFLPISMYEVAVAQTSDLAYTIVDTGQSNCYDSDGETIGCPAEGDALYGQDAQYNGAQFAFQNNGDGTTSDLNTGLMWQVTPSSQSFSWQEAVEYAENLVLAGYDDWRVPSTKELFSISDFSEGWPYLDTGIFDFAGGDTSKDAQYWASYYVGLTHGGAPSAFGVNHATGHIKTYPAEVSGLFGNYVRVVRGDAYGINDFGDNGDGTVTDVATGLMWQQADSEIGMDWEEALAYAEGMELAGYDDWRLPSVKELQSIVDYSKSPNAISTDDVDPAIDTDYFDITALPTGTTAYEVDYGYFWTSTSAYFSPQSPGYDYAWYVAFGTAVGPDGEDTHGAGGVRFDTKAEGGPESEGGERIFNYVRLVRDID